MHSVYIYMLPEEAEKMDDTPVRSPLSSLFRPALCMHILAGFIHQAIQAKPCVLFGWGVKVTIPNFLRRFTRWSLGLAFSVEWRRLVQLA